MATDNGSSNGSSHDVLPSLLAEASSPRWTRRPELPSLVSVLVAAGAGECYHKHGTFLAHLIDVYRILRLWGVPDAIARCGLFHSSYSNSYVNLAIFQPDVSRDRVRGIIGTAAERLVHLFCTDADLRDHLAASEASVQAARAGAVTDASEPWREKLRSVLPPEGVLVPHIRTGEPVVLSLRVMAAFVLMTVADFSDQYTDYQDRLFGNEDGRLEFAGDNWGALWPGTGKPGLWVSAMSRLAALYRLIAMDEELLRAEKGMTAGERDDEEDADIELVIPPVFDGCRKVVDPGEQIAARDLYWEAICSDEADKKGGDSRWRKVEELLRESMARNPLVGEPRLVLAQVLLNSGRYAEAEAAAQEGQKLVVEWGSSWDKRMSWEGDERQGQGHGPAALCLGHHQPRTRQVAHQSIADGEEKQDRASLASTTCSNLIGLVLA